MKAIKWEQGLFSAKYLSSGSSCCQPEPCWGGGRGAYSLWEPRPLLHTLRAKQVVLQAFSTLLCTANALSGSTVALPHVSQLLEVKNLHGLALPMLKGPSLAVLSHSRLCSGPAPESNPVSLQDAHVFSSARGH